MRIMKLAVLALATVSLGFVVGASGCGRTDASAATTEGTPGAPAGKPDEKPAAPTAKADEWSAEAKVTKPTGTEKQWTLEVVLVANKPWHINNEYPFKLAKVGGTGVDVKEEFKKDDPAFKLDKCAKNEKGVEECTELHLTTKFGTSDAKTATIGGELKFGVCSADKCKIDKARLAVALTTAKTS